MLAVNFSLYIRKKKVPDQIGSALEEVFLYIHVSVCMLSWGVSSSDMKCESKEKPEKKQKQRKEHQKFYLAAVDGSQ